MGCNAGILEIAGLVMTLRLRGFHVSGRAGRIQPLSRLLAGVPSAADAGLQSSWWRAPPVSAWASIRFGPRGRVGDHRPRRHRHCSSPGRDRPVRRGGAAAAYERVFYCAGFFSLAMIMSLLVAAFAADRRRVDAWQRLLLEASTVLGDSAPLGERLRRVTDQVSVADLDADCELHVGACLLRKDVRGGSLAAVSPLRMRRRSRDRTAAPLRALGPRRGGGFQPPCLEDLRRLREGPSGTGGRGACSAQQGVARAAGLGAPERAGGYCHPRLAELRFLRINEAMAQINGISAEDHLGRRVLEVFPRREGVALDEGLRRVLETGEPVVAAEVTGESLSRPVSSGPGA